jgi:hypothetical protein
VGRARRSHPGARAVCDGGIVTDRAYLKVFHEARTAALTRQEASSPLLDVPYALRHAAVSTWLNAGVTPPQVAEWAGQRRCTSPHLRQVHLRPAGRS